MSECGECPFVGCGLRKNFPTQGLRRLSCSPCFSLVGWVALSNLSVLFQTAHIIVLLYAKNDLASGYMGINQTSVLKYLKVLNT